MFLKSSEIINIGDIKYLQIFLNKEYSYTIKRDDEEYSILELAFKEPEMSDMSELKKLGISLEKLHSYETIKGIRIANLFSRDTLQEFTDLKKEEIEVEVEEEEIEKDKIDACRNFIADLLVKSSDFEDESSDYFQEIEKFFAFLEKRCFRDHDGIAIKNTLKNLDKHNATAMFIKEEILIEYISFFFDHFPSRSLHMMVNL